LARFSDAVYFSESRFNDSAILGLVKFEDIASFQNVTFVRQLNLKGAQISTMLLENSRFAEDSKINLNDSDFNRLKAHWTRSKIMSYTILGIPGLGRELQRPWLERR